MHNRALTVTLSIVGVLLAAGLVLYFYGGPQAPSFADGDDVGSGEVALSGDGQAESEPGADSAPGDGSPLAIEIPGCVCHSDDPAVVEEHAAYRMSECFGCHADGMPEMGQ